MGIPSTHTDFNLWAYDAGASVEEEYGYYHVLGLSSGNVFNKSIDDIKNILQGLEGYDFTTLDIRSIYYAYQNRLSCLPINHYAINKTKLEFDKMINLFNTFDKTVVLNLYLLVNGMILDIDISEQDMFMHYKFYDQSENEYDYDDYVNDTQPFRERLIDEIYEKINSFV
jgi:hypothetical protein